MSSLKPISVGIDSSLASWGAEIKYVLRTLLRVAGYPHEFSWASTSQPNHFDIYYGLPTKQVTASVSIAACGKPFSAAPYLEPCGLREEEGVPLLDFEQRHDNLTLQYNAKLHIASDIVFSSYWLLTGAREPYYPRDRWDNLNLEGSSFLKLGLVSKPLVSIYGSILRKHFQRSGLIPLDLPWQSSKTGVAFAFSHDVDYPQMIRWIECLRLLGTRGLLNIGSIVGVLRGTNHFWKFSDWIDFAKEFGTRPAFYFLARKGSLAQYAMGTPDGFYDIRTSEFKELFRYLNDEGCEIGLHTSYKAHRSTEQIQHEIQVLEESAGTRIRGNRHHYWHLDPTAPHETLRKHEQAGLLYDSSLELEFYPGYRRGICHPFRVFHPNERRELDLVELPPAWMDDQFDNRLSKNKITDPVDYARGLVRTARTTGGIVVLDYHLRGMNHDFFPKYGRWLTDFAHNYLDSDDSFHTPVQLAQMYTEYESKLDAWSQDHTDLKPMVDIAENVETTNSTTDL